jgi:PKD repeat protein
LWEFGDGIGMSTNYSPKYTYMGLGNYNVSLIASSASGCKDTIMKTIVVQDKPIGINEKTFISNSLLVKTINRSNYIISQSFNSGTPIEYELIDNTGKIMIRKNLGIQNAINIPVNLNYYSRGVYFLKLKYNNVDQKTIKLIAN